jgi:hypothetical protein
VKFQLKILKGDFSGHLGVSGALILQYICREICYEGVDGIEVYHDGDEWTAFLNMEMTRRAP